MRIRLPLRLTGAKSLRLTRVASMPCRSGASFDAGDSQNPLFRANAGWQVVQQGPFGIEEVAVLRELPPMPPQVVVSKLPSLHGPYFPMAADTREKQSRHSGWPRRDHPDLVGTGAAVLARAANDHGADTDDCLSRLLKKS